MNLTSATSEDQNKTVQLLTAINVIQERHHDHFSKLQQAIKNTIRFQSHPAGQKNLTQKISKRNF